MSLIDVTYFQKRLLAIPNLNRPEVANKLSDYITTYESKYLNNMLGLTLKTLFLSGLEEETPDTKWTRLRDGYTYQISGYDYKWSGFVNTDKRSPIANYVFTKFYQDNQRYFTGVGDVVPTKENASRVVMRYTLSEVWNDMSSMNNDLYNFLIQYESDYPTFKTSSVMLTEDNVLGF